VERGRVSLQAEFGRAFRLELGLLIPCQAVQRFTS